MNPIFSKQSLELINHLSFENNDKKNDLSVPQDIWVTIFKNLSFADWRECQYVDKTFHQICFNRNVTSHLLENERVPKNMVLKWAKHVGPLLRKLNLDNMDLTEQEWIDLFHDCPHLQELSIQQDILRKDKHFQFTYAFLEHLPTSLQSLNLAYCGVTNRNLEHLRRLSNLQSLNLHGCVAIIDKGVEHLKVLSHLQSLDLHGCRISDKGLDSLKSLPSLRSLNLSYCCKMTDKGLESLKTFSALQFLNLSNCYKTTPGGLDNLKKTLPNVRIYSHGNKK